MVAYAIEGATRAIAEGEIFSIQVFAFRNHQQIGAEFAHGRMLLGKT